MSEIQVNHPYHYNQGNIECIDAMREVFGVEKLKTFCIINAFKYLWRCNDKESINSDLKKASWYIEKAIELNDNV